MEPPGGWSSPNRQSHSSGWSCTSGWGCARGWGCICGCVGGAISVGRAVPMGGTTPSEWSHSLYSAHNLFLDFSCPVLSERTQKVLIGYLSGTPRTSCPCAVAVSSSVLASRRRLFLSASTLCSRVQSCVCIRRIGGTDRCVLSVGPSPYMVRSSASALLPY